MGVLTALLGVPLLLFLFDRGSLMLRAEDLNLAVPGKILCQDLNIADQTRRMLGYLGNNGSGKTTCCSPERAACARCRPGQLGRQAAAG